MHCSLMVRHASSACGGHLGGSAAVCPGDAGVLGAVRTTRLRHRLAAQGEWPRVAERPLAATVRRQSWRGHALQWLLRRWAPGRHVALWPLSGTGSARGSCHLLLLLLIRQGIEAICKCQQGRHHLLRPCGLSHLTDDLAIGAKHSGWQAEDLLVMLHRPGIPDESGRAPRVNVSDDGATSRPEQSKRV